MKYLLMYLLIINAVGFLLMLVDKSKDRRGRYRIPESTLMCVAAIGGSIGSLLGMYTFRHKTLHPKFTVGIPVILVIQIALVIFFFL